MHIVYTIIDIVIFNAMEIHIHKPILHDLIKITTHIRLNKKKN